LGKQRFNKPKPGPTGAAGLDHNNGSLTNIDHQSNRIQFPSQKELPSTPKKSPERQMDLRQSGHKANRRPSFDRSRSFNSDNFGNKNSKGHTPADLVSNQDKVGYSFDNLEDLGQDSYDIDHFSRYIAFKSLHKERLANASIVATKKEEEYRERIRSAYEAKIERWNKKKETINKQKVNLLKKS